MQRKDYPNHLISPAKISKLSDGEIFVFGSNLQGRHHGGAARTAYEKFGAEWGVGDGPTGKCYAIPTMHGGIDQIKPYVDKFLQYAKENPMKRFLVTRVGCGIAGFTDEEIAPLFAEALEIPNIALPSDWICELLTLGFSRSFPSEKDLPEIITDESLKALTEKYLYEIGAGLKNNVPNLSVRYVRGRDEFGYAQLRNIFFFDDYGMYVWEQDPKWEEDHNQDVVEGVFKDQCFGRGYARRVIYAGIPTGFTDKNGEIIYTGDVVKFFDDESQTFAVGALEYGYGCILDNHALMLAQVKSEDMERVGTVFFQLDNEPFPKGVTDRTKDYNGWYDTAEERQLKNLMAQYTPNFDQEVWKYKALKVLEIEFNWRK